MRNLIDVTGQTFGKLTALGEAPKLKIKRRWFVKCICEKVFDVDLDTLRGGKSTACLSCNKIRHGKSVDTKVYRAWDAMVRRCVNPNHKSYKNYGGRGIKVSEDWLDFANFYRDMGEPPDPKSTLDRIDNEGPYEKNNVRWTQYNRQIWSQRKRSNTAFEYKGVSCDGNRYRARYGIGKKMINLGSFDTPEEAAKAWDKKALKERGPDARLNFPI